MKRASLIALFSLAAAVSASAVNYTNSWNSFTQGATVPDGDFNGWQDTRMVNLTNEYILSIGVTLDIANGFNGDVYARLTHGTDFAVLLNRPGVTASNPDGYGDTGFQVTFNDAPGAGNDAHLYRDWSNPNGGVLTGTWASDGRASDPSTVLDTDLRLFTLDRFLDKDAGGEWTLFLVDAASGEEMTVNNWGLRLNTVPEPSTGTLMGLGLLAWLALSRRRMAARATPVQRKPARKGSRSTHASLLLFFALWGFSFGHAFPARGEIVTVTNLWNSFETWGPGQQYWNTNNAMPYALALPAGGIPSAGQWMEKVMYNDVNWNQATNGHDGNPVQARSNAWNDGAHFARFFSEQYDNVTRLITPTMNFGNATNATLTFWHCQVAWPSDQDYLRVLIHTNFTLAAVTNNEITPLTFGWAASEKVPLTNGWQEAAWFDQEVAGWTERTIILTNVSSNTVIAFEGYGNYAHGVCIDDLMITSEAVLSPVRTVNAVSATWAGGTAFDWEINQADGTAGADPGWDLLNITDALNITATGANPFTVNLLTLTPPLNAAGPMANFTPTQSHTWPLVHANGGIVGFHPDKFTLSGTGFLNDLSGGTLALAVSGKNLLLTFTPATNHPPVANPNSLATFQNQAAHVSASKLMANDTDADGNTLTVTGVSAGSSSGGTASLSAGIVTYTPATGYTGADTFTYSITDGQGGVATATVTVTVRANNTAQPNMSGIQKVGEEYVIKFVGLGGRQYVVQRAPTVTGSWTDLTPTVTMPAYGVATFTNTPPDSGSYFYRAMLAP